MTDRDWRLDGRRPVIFCDFDGTITQRDVIEMIMERFAPPQWRDIVADILDRRTLSIRDGVSQLFRLLPGTLQEEIVAFVQESVSLRPGFPAFLSFCRAHHIPFLVVSGGVDFFMAPVLAPYRDQLSLFCNTAWFYPDRIELDFPHLDETCEPCGQCACCKVAIMNTYPPQTYYRIAIGDSLTDLAMAQTADWTFARARLIGYTAEIGLPVTPFETFGEIQTHLQQVWQEAPHGLAG